MLDYVKQQLEKYDHAIEQAIAEIRRIEAECQVLIKILENLKSNQLGQRDE